MLVIVPIFNYKANIQTHERVSHRIKFGFKLHKAEQSTHCDMKHCLWSYFLYSRDRPVPIPEYPPCHFGARAPEVPG